MGIVERLPDFRVKSIPPLTRSLQSVYYVYGRRRHKQELRGFYNLTYIFLILIKHHTIYINFDYKISGALNPRIFCPHSVSRISTYASQITSFPRIIHIVVRNYTQQESSTFFFAGRTNFNSITVW